MDNSLKNSIKELENYIKEKNEGFIKYPIGVFFNSNAIIKNSSNTVFGLVKQANPYFIVFNEYIIILFFKKSQIKGMKYTFFGLEKSFDYTEHINIDDKDFNVGIINNKIWEVIKARIFGMFARLKHQEFIRMFTFVANHYNLSFNNENVKAFIDRILNENTTFADRYDKNRILSILKEELIKLPKQ